MTDNSNWLHAERLRCPACQADLWRVDHSPFYDELFLYCDTCPRHAEVSFYDPHYKDAAKDEATRRHLVEARLKLCGCGGHFRFAAARRCPTCWTPVIVDAPVQVDLYYWDPCLEDDAPDPSDEALEAYSQKMNPLIRTEDLWLDE